MHKEKIYLNFWYLKHACKFYALKNEDDFAIVPKIRQFEFENVEYISLITHDVISYEIYNNEV